MSPLFSKPRITIITPSFNQGRYIEQTILSVLEQNYPNLEYIVIDGGSTDNSLDIIRKYEKYISFWVSEPDNGQSNAINKGIQRSSGEIINWLNSDDYYMPGALHHVAEQFKRSAINVYCGRSRVFSETEEKFSTGTDVYHGNLFKTIGWARIDQPETFFRRSVWEKIGLLDEQFHYIMDKEWWMRYLITYGLEDIICDKQIIVNFRIHEQSKTSSQKEEFKKEGLSLFYSICRKNGMTDACRLLEKLYNVQELEIADLYENEGSYGFINYFFFYLFSLAYASNDYTMAKEIRKILKPSRLTEEDLVNFKKISFRMCLVPPFLKQMYNSLHFK